jgi:hypothetical protein
MRPQVILLLDVPVFLLGCSSVELFAFLLSALKLMTRTHHVIFWSLKIEQEGKKRKEKKRFFFKKDMISTRPLHVGRIKVD